MKKIIITISILLICINSLLADENSLCAEDCTFVLLSEETGEYQLINEARATQRFSPYSTFKIPNSLIALDTGSVDDLEQKLTFDPAMYPIQEWWPQGWYKEPLNLQDAFRKSAVPIYQEIATMIGVSRMQTYLDRFNFGNRDISSGIDTFWLGASLRISAKEQVAFIQKIYRNELPVTDRTLTLFKAIMLVEKTDQYRVYAKTGSGRMESGRYIGWYVGYVENQTGAHYFALNISADTFQEIQHKRIELAESLLAEAGVL